MLREYLRRERCRGCKFAKANGKDTVCDMDRHTQVERIEYCSQDRKLDEHTWQQLIMMDKEMRMMHEKTMARF